MRINSRSDQGVGADMLANVFYIEAENDFHDYGYYDNDECGRGIIGNFRRDDFLDGLN